ncbi:uncharacterized protein G2W53_042525 [Senna tora]|uniref:Secreted protein n=1 Tax=Senna tora TaxID=362788 RepID=A0A834SU11_9FABA|nr:uncharacterized protein G2W53_042525 [Senna tora]
MPFGWPLGLSFLSMRLRVAESLPAAPAEPYSVVLHAPSSSFSSFSSSNLDTESSASFFQDNSVSLGRLIGIRGGGEGGRLYFPNSLRLELEKNGCEEVDRSGGNNSICIPILLDAFLKTSRTKKTSRN